jgi:hypothetical protein
MSFSFERSYQVAIGFIEGTSFTPVVQIEPPHHIEFASRALIPNLGSSLNPCALKLFNIGEENVKALSQKGLTAVVKAGYKFQRGIQVTPNELDVIFMGDVMLVDHNQTGLDVVSTLHCQEGHHVAANSKSDLSVSTGSTYGQVFKTLAADFGLDAQLYFSFRDEVFKIDDTLQGRTLTMLDKVARQASKDKGNQVTWCFNRGKLLVTDRFPKAAFSKSGSYLIPRDRIKDTLQIGLDETYASEQNTAGGISTLKFKAYLLPEIYIGDTIKVEGAPATYFKSVTEDREFIVMEISHNLAYDGGVWDTTVQARVKQ